MKYILQYKHTGCSEANIKNMIKNFKIILICILLIPFKTNACAVLSEREQIAKDEADLKQLIELTQKLTGTVDKIVIANAVEVDETQNSAQFELIEIVFGDSDSGFNVLWDDSRIIVGCNEAAVFFNVNIEKDQTYLLYIENDQILRASADLQPRVGMGFIHELLIVRNVLSALKL